MLRLCLALGAESFPLLAVPAPVGISSTQPAKCRLLGLLPPEESLWLSEPHTANRVSTLRFRCFKSPHLEHSTEDEWLSPTPRIINSLSFV